MARSGPVCVDSTAVALGLAQIRIGKSAAHISNTNVALTASDSIGAMASTQFKSETNIFEFKSGYPIGTCALFPLETTSSIIAGMQELTVKNMALAQGLDPFSDVDADVVEVHSNTASGTTTGSITVDNNGGVVNDTWTVVFTSSTTYQVIGNMTGDVGDGDVSSSFAPDNGGHPYFTIPANFFSGTWADDESYVFKTTAYESGTTAYANNHSGAIGLGNVSTPAIVRAEFIYTFPDGVHTMNIIAPRAQVKPNMSVELASENPAAITLEFQFMEASSGVSGGHAAWDTMPQGVIRFA